MKAKVCYSTRCDRWRVIEGGDILMECKTEELALAYCAGYNQALDDKEPLP